MTFRDDVWSIAIQRLCMSSGFMLSDLGFEDDDRHTVRRVLIEMESLGWLARERKRSGTWQPGPTALAHLNRRTEGE